MIVYCYFIGFLRPKTAKGGGREPPGPMALYIHVELHARGFLFWVYI